MKYLRPAMFRATTCTILFIGAVTGVFTASVTTHAQSPATQPNDARSSYERFLQSDLSGPEISFVMSNAMTRAMERVKADPTLAGTKQRLLAIQEKSVPLSDPGSQPSYEELLAEVVGSERVAAVYAQVFYWNKVAMDATAEDHTPPPPGGVSKSIEQIGPARTSRAMAIVHIAMFEALNTVHRKYETYHGIQGEVLKQFNGATLTADNVSERHAVAYAAYETLRMLYPSQELLLSTRLGQNVGHIPELPGPGIGSDTPEQVGEKVGKAAAAAIWADRLDDRSMTTNDEPAASLFDFPGLRNWHKDPLNADPNVALGAFWLYVRPFVMESGSQFRTALEGPPAFDSPKFKAAFEDVFHEGVDKVAGSRNPPGNADRLPPPDGFCTRDDDEEFIGKFWAYDATPALCAPPRLYNMIATSLANNEKQDAFNDGLEFARFLAILNVAMADAGIAAWDAKWTYLFPRPVTYIRDSSAMTKWAPLGAPVTNAKPDRVNFTPPFPSYPSGHAVFGGAIFQVMRKSFNSDDEFVFLSDEYNGENRDPGAAANRPKKPVKFPSFTAAEKENGRSRIYLGIHWQFDADDGIVQGNAVADYVMEHLYTKPQP